jgi:hypothetical protein
MGRSDAAGPIECAALQRTAELRERLERWARGLPVDEPIPITGLEVYELALYTLSLRSWAPDSDPSCADLDWILRTIQQGRFRLAGHLVVVI